MVLARFGLTETLRTKQNSKNSNFGGPLRRDRGSDRRTGRCVALLSPSPRRVSIFVAVRGVREVPKIGKKFAKSGPIFPCKNATSRVLLRFERDWRRRIVLAELNVFALHGLGRIRPRRGATGHSMSERGRFPEEIGNPRILLRFAWESLRRIGLAEQNILHTTSPPGSNSSRSYGPFLVRYRQTRRVRNFASFAPLGKTWYSFCSSRRARQMCTQWCRPISTPREVTREQRREKYPWKSLYCPVQAQISTFRVLLRCPRDLLHWLGLVELSKCSLHGFCRIRTSRDATD